MVVKTSVVPNVVSKIIVEGEEKWMLLIDNDNKKNKKKNAHMSATR
jgi:hypothetical protein